MSKLFFARNNYGREILIGDDIELKYRNFSGMQGKFPNPNNKNFDFIIDDPEMVAELQDRGCNVKIRPVYNGEEGEVVNTLNAKLNYATSKYPPVVTLWCNGVATPLNEKDVAETLDHAIINKLGFECSLVDQKDHPGRKTIYVNKLSVVIEPDYFALYGAMDGENPEE